MLKVLFVCLGNICRSPMAESIFNQLVAEAKLSNQLSCDSAGTAAYHIGDLPDKRMRKTAETHGIHLNHQARQISQEDFNNFDYILAMDNSNYLHIHQLKEKVAANSSTKIQLMRHFDTNTSTKNVPDPYYGSMQDFEEVYQILLEANQNFLSFLSSMSLDIVSKALLQSQVTNIVVLP